MKRIVSLFVLCAFCLVTFILPVSAKSEFSDISGELAELYAAAQAEEKATCETESECKELKDAFEAAKNNSETGDDGEVSLFAIQYYSGTEELIPTYTSVTGYSVLSVDKEGVEGCTTYSYRLNTESCAEYLAYLTTYCGWEEIDSTTADDNSFIIFAFGKNRSVMLVSANFILNEVHVVVPDDADASVTGVSLNKSSLQLTTGDSAGLTATVSPSNATNKNVTWTSSNTSVATVSSSGVVTAKAAGTAKITVKTVDGSKTATCTVTVTKAATSALKGDIDGNGVVNTNDAIYLLFHIMFPNDYPLN